MSNLRRLPLRPLAGRRPRGRRLIGQEVDRQSTHAAAHRLGELHLAGGAGRLGLGPDQQVLRGLSGPALLRRQPGHRRGGGPGPRPGQGPVRGRARQRPAPRRGQRQPRRLPGAARAGRHHPGHAPRPRRPPDPRLAGLHHLEDLALRVLRRDAGHRRPGRTRARSSTSTRWPHLAKTEQPDADRGRAPPPTPASSTRCPFRGDRRLGRRAVHVRRRPSGRPHRRRRPPEPGRGGRRRHLHHPQDAARAPGRRHLVPGPSWPRTIDSAVFPGLQGGPLEHVIAAKAVAFAEAARPEFRQYAAQVVANAAALGEAARGRRASGWSPAAPTTTWCSSTCAPSTPS